MDGRADAPDGFEAGPAANNERLYLPDIHPAGSNGIWLVVEVDDVEIAEIFISHGGIQGATGADRRLILPVSLTADALIRTGFCPVLGRQRRIFTHRKFRHAFRQHGGQDIPRGRAGEAGGGGPGGGLSQAQVDARVKAALVTALTGTQTGITVTLQTTGR